jgi:hypothetical protein
MLVAWLLTLGCLAKGRNALLVLQAQGSAIPPAIASGSWVTAEQSLEIPKGCQLTLLVMGEGKRVRVTGPSTVRFQDGVLQAQGGRLVDLTSPVHKLALTGENHRIVAGVVAPVSKMDDLDPGPPPPLPNSPWKVEVLPENRLRLSRPGQGPQAAPLNLVFCVTHEPYRIQQGRLQAGMLKTLSSQRVEGQEDNGRWVYEAQIPPGNPGKLGLRMQQPGEEFYVPVCSLSSDQAQELESFQRASQSWAEAEPNSVEPYVAYAAAAEEWAQLEQALAAVEKALKIGESAGLWRMAARIQIDMARYADADQSQARAAQLESR